MFYKSEFLYDMVFYLYKLNNKHLARGNSLAWRTNNPGLVHSHNSSPFRYRPIGSAGQIAIFSTPEQGEKNLINWLKCKKYQESTLIIIAKHYQPEKPETFLELLLKTSPLSPDKLLKNFSNQEFNELIGGIKNLTGYTQDQDKPFSLLPKITARFYSKNAQIESYLIGSDTFLNKHKAIDWVESYRLDAVIVHKKDGSIYLRSRPGHHIEKIHLNEKEGKKEIEFEEIARGEIGEKRSGQCIWAFINGVKNNEKEAEASTKLISNYVNGEQVWSLANDTKLYGLGDITESILFKINIESQIVKWGIKFLKFLLNLSKEDPKNPPIILITHSQGAMIANLALNYLKPEECKKIRIFTFGGWALTPPGKCHSDSHNFFSQYDPISKFGSPIQTLALIECQEDLEKGLSKEMILEKWVERDVDFYLDTTNDETQQLFRKERKEYYQKLLQEISNTTILKDAIEGPIEHSFKRPCYQKALEQVLRKYIE